MLLFKLQLLLDNIIFYHRDQCESEAVQSDYIGPMSIRLPALFKIIIKQCFQRFTEIENNES
jgi:hypothetical protein